MQKHNKRSFPEKLIIVSSILFTLGLASVTTLAADGNITSIIQGWFDKQETEAIEEIDASIKEVRIEQTERLKTTLQDMLDEQKADLDELVEAEKAKRTDALENYADDLIEDVKADHSESSEGIELPTAELDAIMENAKQQMAAVVEREVSEEATEKSKADEDEKVEDEKAEEGKETEDTEGSEKTRKNEADENDSSEEANDDNET